MESRAAIAMVINPHFHHCSLSVLSSWHSQHSTCGWASQPISAKSGVNTKGSECLSDWPNILLEWRRRMKSSQFIKLYDLLWSKQSFVVLELQYIYILYIYIVNILWSSRTEEKIILKGKDSRYGKYTPKCEQSKRGRVINVTNFSISVLPPILTTKSDVDN